MSISGFFEGELARFKIEMETPMKTPKTRAKRPPRLNVIAILDALGEGSLYCCTASIATRLTSHLVIVEQSPMLEELSGEST